MKKFNIIFFVIIILSGIACKKKTPAIAITKTDMVSRTWVCEQADVLATTRSIIYKKGTSGNLLELKDSFVTFMPNGTYQGIDFNSSPQKGTWVFKNNETIADLADWAYPFEIVTLTENNLDFNTKVAFQGKVYDIFVKMIPKN
jgi:hypothetical protein